MQIARNITVIFLASLAATEYAVAEVTLGAHEVAGQTLTVVEVDGISSLTVRIAACGQGVIYATRSDGSLWFNKSGGVQAEWKTVTAGAPGPRIACDRLHLYSLDRGTLYHATTLMNGQLQPLNKNTTAVWTTTRGDLAGNTKTLAVPSGTDEIQSGMGNIYALAYNPSTHVGTLYSSQSLESTSSLEFVQGVDWLKLADNLGANRATGAGSRAWHNAYTNSLPYTKRNRAFGANPDDTLYYNSGMLDGTNSWTGFPNAGLNILQITAEDSNTLYALTLNRANRQTIVRYSFSESDCTDHRDNDANGQIDAEDPACRTKLAIAWCRRHQGSFCIDRLESTNGYDHALVSCTAGALIPKIEAGVCTHAPTAGNDYLAPYRTNNEPYNAGHYCSVIYPDGSWDFDWVGGDPCATLLAGHESDHSFIARAGIYSKSELNNVFVRCNNGSYLAADDNGIAPLVNAKAAVGHTQNRCVFTVSPKSMSVFNAPIPTLAWSPPSYLMNDPNHQHPIHTYGRGYSVGHMFDHAPACQAGDSGCPCSNTIDCPVPLLPFGGSASDSTTILDNRGMAVATAEYDMQNAYDYNMTEGVPLRSLGYGRVVANGSRDRDVSSGESFGTPYQGEIYVRYDVGSDLRYQESFIAYYAHVGMRVVTDGQTVEPGQLLGYVGTTGSSSGPHLHFGLIRLTNTNGHTTDYHGEAFGYKVPFATETSAQGAGTGYNREAEPGTIDPYGWRAPGQDPMAHLWAFAQSRFFAATGVIGIGAWSPRMWRAGEEPPYPPEE